MDVGAVIRVRNAAREALTATPSDQGSAWRGLIETYRILLQQAREVIGEEVRPELVAMFPREIDARGADADVTRSPSALFRHQEVASEARTRIASLAGWLDGHIEEAKFSLRLDGGHPTNDG